MNTLDTVATDHNKFVGDKLDQIFAAQKALMVDYKPIAEVHYSKIFGQNVKFSDEMWAGGEANLHTKAGNYMVVGMLNAAIQELAESIQTLKNWKPWKATEMPSDAAHFKEEMVDGLHFYIEACLFAGMTAEELHSIYFKKHAVNIKRQETNY
jgi:hypothetical protein